MKCLAPHGTCDVDCRISEGFCHRQSRNAPFAEATMTEASKLRSLLAAKPYVKAAGAYDALSALLIAEAGFDVVYTTGFGISTSKLGRPDAELYTMTENLEVVRAIAEISPLPVIADIDTGYGNVMNVERSVKSFEAAGCAGVVIEDQVFPKRCPAAVHEVETVSLVEAVARVKAALDARRDEDTVVIARTDTRGSEQLERAQAFAEAGADLINPISRSFAGLSDLEVFARSSPVPILLNILGWLETGVPQTAFERLNVKIINFPLVPLQITAAALSRALGELCRANSVAGVSIARMDMEGLKRLVGFSELEAKQKHYNDTATAFVSSLRAATGRRARGCA